MLAVSRAVSLDLRAVARPIASHRPAPFWSWNEAMEPDQIRRQVREMARGGLGGGFIHVRVGLVTPYMGEEFLAAIAVALEEARAQGLHMYLYDEDRWPSGWAGGAVPLADSSFRTKWLLRLPAGERPPDDGGATLLAEGSSGERYYRYVSPLGQAWFSGTSYADLMDRRAMRTFLDAAYEPYAARFGADFGGLIPAIFTDEPAITFLPAYCDVPRGMLFWTDELPERFLSQHGYALPPRMAELFEDVGDYAATRTDFYRTCAWLFEHHFSRQLGEWCRAHGIALTGHYMLEGSLAANLAWDVCTLPHYRHMDWPGIDHLGRQVEEVITGLGCRSVVNQYGKSRMSSELYGCAGQHISFEDRKWIAEQQIILGVNLLVPHLLLYTMAGERKRDYPCNMWYQQPWWPLNGVVDDYLARLCTLLSQGRMAPELLLLHPIESLYPVRRPPSADQGPWDTQHRDDDARLIPLDRRFQALSRHLLGTQRQFDYGDETILADVAAVVAEGGRPLLRVGEMDYPLVLLPDLISIRATTLELLERFAGAGGPILAAGALPTMVDGRPDRSGRLAGLLLRIRRVSDVGAEDPSDLDDLLDRLAPPLVAFEGHGPRQWLWQHTRTVGDTQVLLLVNLHRRDTIAGTLQLGALIRGPLARLDLVANTYAMLAAGAAALPPIPLILEPGESLVLVAGAADLPPFASRTATPSPGALVPRRTLDGWTVERLDENALTLDMASARRGDGPFGPAAPVIALQQVLNADRYDGSLTLRYSFSSELDSPASEAARLVLERPERCAVRVNGMPVAEGELPPWRDFRWHQIAIGHALRPGENVVELRYPDFRYGDATSVHDQARRYGTEIEAVYLVGEFAVACSPASAPPGVAPPEPTPPWTLCAVQGPFTIQSPRPLVGGNLTGQGLPFYAGRVACRATLTLDGAPDGPLWLALDRLSVPVVEVLVNGQHAGHLAWHPYRLAIGDLLRAGENSIELVLYHSLRNLLGPHHHPEGEPYWVGPNSFRGEGEGWAERLARGEPEPSWLGSYALTEFGLFGEVRLLSGTDA